jgi:transcriptional regulator with GAF, ATPase, and Fis domain
MKPRLVGIAGPLKGTQVPLCDGEIVIGRDPTNRVATNDPLVSRRHCCFRYCEGDVVISDLDSLNGTFINGESAREKKLEHGDRIKVGDSQFVFLVNEDSVDDSDLPDDLLGDELIPTVTIRLDGKNATRLESEAVKHIGSTQSRPARDLAALLKINTAINGIRNPAELERRVLEMLFEVVPVERAAILLVGQNSGEVVSGEYRSRENIRASFVISRTIVGQVLHDGVAVLANDVLSDKKFEPTESIVASRISALLCVPLLVFGSSLGVIYADTTDSNSRIDEHHLRLLTAIASITAVALEHVRYVEWLEGENQRLQEEINIQHGMVGESQRMHQVYQTVGKVMNKDSTVLIGGESGTGKELVARAIHRNGKRANRAFVAVNCAALTESLIESELFGHERGAFTGAVTQKKGKIEIADGGTLFLDEISELPTPVQGKLLRVLQEREFERVGGTRTIKVDIRLIAASNRNLDELVKSNQFRQDLFFRLNVVSVILPPLRERREDIPLLVTHFIQKYSREANRTVSGISREALALLTNYDWPGNVRELQNTLERAVVLGSSELIRPEDLPEALVESSGPSVTTQVRYHDAVNHVKRNAIKKAIEQAHGNFTEAAKLLDLHPNYLHRLVRNMDLRKDLRS